MYIYKQDSSFLYCDDGLIYLFNYLFTYIWMLFLRNKSYTHNRTHKLKLKLLLDLNVIVIYTHK
jgi:hypothetical protein